MTLCCGCAPMTGPGGEKDGRLAAVSSMAGPCAAEDSSLPDRQLPERQLPVNARRKFARAVEGPESHTFLWSGVRWGRFGKVDACFPEKEKFFGEKPGNVDLYIRV